MTVYDSKMEYLLSNPDPHMFYMFKELTSLYKCRGEQYLLAEHYRVIADTVFMYINFRLSRPGI
jgi:hypothetical protein